VTADPLLASLTRERFNGHWWTQQDPQLVDDDLTCRKRRRALSEALDDHGEEVA